MQSYSTSHPIIFNIEVNVTGTSLKLEGLTVHGCPRPRPSGSRHIRVQLHINIVHKHSTLHMTLHWDNIPKEKEDGLQMSIAQKERQREKKTNISMYSAYHIKWKCRAMGDQLFMKTSVFSCKRAVRCSILYISWILSLHWVICGGLWLQPGGRYYFIGY